MKKLLLALLLAALPLFLFSQTITVIQPNGTEILYPCQSYTVSWSTSGAVSGYYDIDYSLDGGTIWASISSNYLSPAKTYIWTVPNVQSNTVLIRVKDSQNGVIVDQSNAFFSINIPITVTAPNGGETLIPGTVSNITWNAQGTSNTYNIAYSINGGSTWTTIISNYSSIGGTYAWTVPNVPSTNCLIRVQDAVTTCMADQSNSAFTIQPLTPQLTYPNGGEQLNVGQSINILWDQNTFYSTVRLEFSLDNGLTWNNIATSTPNDGTQSWTIPYLPLNQAYTQCLVRVSNSTTPALNDVSNVSFTIRKPLTLTSPNGGETLTGCNTFPISSAMFTSGLSNWSIFYSTDNGNSWNTIINNNSTASYNWTIPNALNSAQGLIRVVNNTYPQYSDTSDAVFTFTTSSDITVTAPNGGEILNPGQTFLVSWTNTANVSGAYSLSYSSSAGNGTIVTNITGNNYLWTVPNLPASNYTLNVFDFSNNCKSDANNAPFTVTPKTPKLIYPNGGEAFNVGQTITIDWDESTYYSSSVRIEYSDNGGLTWNVIQSNYLTSNGFYNWAVPHQAANLAYGQCLVKVSESSNLLRNDVSDNTFTIKRPITILTPNGGETLNGCNIVNIAVAINFSGSASWRYEYSTDNGANWNNIISAHNSSNYSWTVPNGINSSQVLLRVSNNSYAAYVDTSNAVFSIAPSNDITVTNPAGGQVFTPGQTVLITWTNTPNVSGLYNISGPGGGIVSSIAGNSFLWTVSNNPTTNGFISVIDAGNTCKTDQNDSAFTINQKTPKLIYPNGGEAFNVGQTVTIDWDETSYYSTSVRIEYSMNGGLTWNVILSNYSTSNGFYNWVVPHQAANLAYGQCLVKVSESSNLLRNDVSDNTFTIKRPITILTPNGGETINGCNVVNITTENNVSGSTSWRFEYSTDNGATWNNIVSSHIFSYYSWTVPNGINSSQALLRVSNNSYAAYVDTSNAVFSIAPSNDITVTNPTGGQVFTPGQTVSITWNNTANVSGLYNISGPGGGIANNITGNSFLWTVSNNPTTNGFISVIDAGNTCKTDQNDSAFTINQKTPKLIYPNGSEAFNVGQTVTIDWDETSYYSTNVRIEYSINGGLTWNLILSNYATSNSFYNWVVPQQAANLAYGQCLVKVSESSNLLRNDVSDNTFTIRRPITILTPNGGETINGCNVVNITTAINLAGIWSYRYEYSTDNGATWNNITTTQNSSYSWTVPNGINSSQALIRVYNTSQTQYNDSSNAVFSIAPSNDITVTSPTGGQVFTPGQTVSITWNNTANVSGLYNISGPGGGIASNITGNSFLWTVSNNPTTNGFISVIDAGNTCKTDQNDSAFTINQKTPKLLYPNGGEAFNVAQSINIDWDETSYYSTNVRIEYSINGGITWNIISNSYPTGNGYYSWTIPLQAANLVYGQCLVKVSETTNLLRSDVSDNTFSIKRAVTVLSPNGGETLNGCDAINISAAINYTPTVYWQFEYSVDSGATWNTIVSQFGSSYNWTVPNGINTTKAMLRVFNTLYPQYNDSSNAVFSIQSQNHITVVTPNGGENISALSNYMINWINQPSVSGVYNLTYSSSAGSGVIANNITGNNYLWTAPNLPASNYTITVRDASNSCKSDQNDAPFTVGPQAAKVLSPNGGEVLYYGQSYNITWDQSTYYENVRIDYSTDNGISWIPISTAEVNDGSYSWSGTARPNIYSPSCLIKISHLSNLQHFDISDAVFTIKPAVTILTPNGGENLGGCTVTTLSFERSPAYSTYSLQYSENGGSTWTTISSNFSASGNPSLYNWTLPNNPTTQGMVRVTPTVLSSAFADVSNATFTVIKPVTIIQPNYGGALQVGSTYTIAWQSDGISNFYDIFYSIDGGSTWISIVSNYPTSTNTYTWTVPNSPSGNCLIRVRDAINTCKEDVSDVPFSITTSAPLIAVITPNGQDSLAGCSLKNIQWNAHPSVTSVNIAYSLNGGSTWVPVVNNYTTSNSYAWSVPNTATSNALVRVTSFSNNAIFDQSDALFHIIPSTLQITSPAADTTICSGQQVQLAISGGNGTYSWTGAGLSSNSIPNPLASPPGTTKYVVSSTSGSCVLKDSVTITVSNNPALLASVSINANPGTALCTGDNVSFTAVPVNGGMSPSYQWMHNGAPAGTNSAVYTPASVNNNDQIWVVMTSSQTCVTGSPAASLTSIINITPASTPSVSVSASPGASICAGTAVQFSATALNAGSTPVYQWKVNGINVGSNSASFTSSSLSNGDIVTVEVQSSLSCASPASVTSAGVTISTVGVPAQPGIINGPATACSGNTITYNVSPVAGATSYNWTLPAGWSGTSVNNAITVTTGANGGAIEVQAVNACGTSSNSSINVSISASPTSASAGADQQVCASSALLSANTPLIGSGSWTVFSGGATLSDPNIPNPSVSNLSTGSNAFIWSIQSGGCQASNDTIYIHRADVPTPADAGNTITVCAGTSSVTLQGNTPLSGNGQWTLVSGSASIASPGNPNTILSNLSTGVHVLEWTISNGNCAASSDQVSVIVEASPVLNVNASSSSVCQGTPVVLTAGGADTYTWMPGNLSGSNVVVSPTNTTIYTVSGTNASGCTSTANITINVSTSVPVQISASDTVICSGDLVTLTAGGAGNYLWMPGNLSGNSIVVNPSATTTYTVSGDISGCTGSASMAIIVQNVPTLSINSADSVCQGSSLTLSAGGAGSYTWMPGNLSGNSITVSPSATTTYTLTGTNAAGCSSTISRTIHTVNIPAVSASASAATVCAGGSVTLNASGAQNYVWTPANQTGSSISVSPSATTTYTVTGSNAFGCSNSAQVQVTVNSVPAVSVSATQAAICAGASTTLTASGADIYTWMPGNLSGNSITVSPSATTTYTVTGTTANGCSAAATYTVQVQNAPNVQAFASQSTICAGTSATLTASGATSYTWQPGNLSGSSVSVTPSATTTYVVSGTHNGCTSTATVTVQVQNSAAALTLSANDTSLCAGETAILTVSGGSSYIWQHNGSTGTISTVSPSATTSYTVTGLTAGGCQASASILIHVSALPVIQVNTSQPSLCAGSSTTLSASGAASYTWMPGNLSGSSISVSPSATTTYTVTGSTANGCQASVTQNISVQNKPVITAGAGNTSICAGASTTLSASGAGSYTWLPGNQSGASVTVSPATSTSYQVIGFNGNCSDTTQVNIIVNALPAVTLNATNATICAGTSTTLNAGGANSYQWTPGNLSGSSITVSPATTTSYTVSGTDNNNCSSSASVTVSVISAPVLQINTSATEICAGAEVTLSVNGNGNYTWQPGNINAGSITVSPLSTTSYTVSDNTQGNCNASGVQAITVHALPVVSFGPVPDQCNLNPSFALDQGMPAGGSYSGTGVSGGAFDPGTGIGNYTLTYTYTDANGCTNTAPQNVEVYGCLGVDEEFEASVTLFPNPTHGEVYIRAEGIQIDRVELFNDLGAAIGINITQQNGMLYFSISHLSDGIYFARIYSGDKTLIRKVIKNH